MTTRQATSSHPSAPERAGRCGSLIRFRPSSCLCSTIGSAALFLLELTTGIRRGQICGLKWSAVDLDAGEITMHDNRVVVGGYAQDKEGGKTKNADQTISIDRATVGALRRWRMVQNREREFF